MKIKNSKDFWSGVMFIGTGLFFMLWAIFNYQMGTAVRMGPAYFPAVLGGLLAFLGLIVLVESFALEGSGKARRHRKHRRHHRRHSTIQFDSVTPGFSGQAPGTSSESGASPARTSP